MKDQLFSAFESTSSNVVANGCVVDPFGRRMPEPHPMDWNYDYVWVGPIVRKDGKRGWGAVYGVEGMSLAQLFAAKEVNWVLTTPPDADPFPTALLVMQLVDTRLPGIRWFPAPKHGAQDAFLGRIVAALDKRCSYHDDQGRQCIYDREHQKDSDRSECSFG